jgi:glycosyltransferase involved in cell wall biosynthesis
MVQLFPWMEGEAPGNLNINMELTLIMPAKNAGHFIIDALKSLNEITETQFELIVVNDESSDDTFEKVESFRSESNYPINLVNNPYSGKVKALSYGYTLSIGEYIKCIDADDLLLPKYFDLFKEKPNFDAHCHNAIVVDSLLNNIGIYTINSSFLRSSYTAVMTNFISLPRWTWTFTRDIANMIFPIPEDLPFEDVWYSIIIKKYATSIIYSPHQYYLYRQHDSQTFGGIYNYNDDLIRFRAKRLIRYIEILLSKKTLLYDDFQSNKSLVLINYKYNEFLEKKNLSFFDLVKADINFTHKIKILLFKNFSIIVPSVKKFSWLIERARRRLF